MNPCSPRAPAEAGFTLIETLVALALLAISSVALLGATEGHVSRIAGLEERAAAQWVAENRLVELTLGPTTSIAPPAMLGYDFVVTEDHIPSADPALEKVVVVVSDAASRQTYARMTGFVDLGDGAAQ